MTLQQNNTEFEEFANDVARCLSSKNKYISPKYLYDKVGSQLFEQICLQPEYYLTRTEASLLNKHAPFISKLAGSNIKIIELGSGSSSKTAILLSYLSSQKKRIYYFPIDISSSILIESKRKLKSQFPNASIIGIRSDYETGIDRAAAECMAIGNNKNIPYTKLVLFLGSSIGNFELIEAQSLLRSVREKLHTNDFLLIGFDLQKDKSVLNAAYNDKAAMTAKFNLNLLARINRELGGNFELGKFNHCAFYSHERHRIEMHLVSKTDQQLYIGALGKTFAIRKGESIHTENSYKYSLSQIAALAEDCGFTVEKNFTDEKRWFDLALFSPS
ncbi:MAG: L-histidine N(alpha)-methyltransferase [Thermoproteota archaeon]|jgi:L-histidine N-alpha-methyltransferase|nr:L-histidine N(alpha)-methyltransferase [Thermoproteota archaeon]MDQ3969345.1 L-histidine N(alpha)-methyltransferase [Thermoproteota archaeon]